MKLFIGCSASNYIPKKYFDDCEIFLEELFGMEHDLVFGACVTGIMGLAYDVALRNGRNVEGIYPNVYKDGAKNLDCYKISTKTINERTEMAIKESDVLIFLPGGFGTNYELLTAIECRRAYEFGKPIIIYNSCGYFDKLFEFFELTYDEGFADRKVNDFYYICDSAKDAIDYIDRYYLVETKKRKKIKDID